MSDTGTPPAKPTVSHRTAGERPRLDELSGLRLLAICYVILFHLGDAAFADVPVAIERARRQANVVMPLFFVLSGFVLTYSYREPIATGRIGVRAFLFSRFARLWPIYLVALALRFAVDAYVNEGVPMHAAAGAIAQALMIQGFIPPLVWYGNAPGWTVCVEACFYLSFPWLVVRLARCSIGVALVIALGLWIAGQSCSLAYALTLPDGWPPPGPPNALYLDLLRYLPPLHLPSFVLGIVTARFFVEEGPWLRWSGGRVALLGLIPVVFTLAGGFQILGLIVWPFPFTHNGLLAPAWALLIYGLGRGAVGGRWLATRPLVRLGEASYALYILHFPVYDAVVTWLVPEWDRRPWFLVQVFALMLPLSLLSFERFEQPLRRRLLRWWDRRHGGAS